MMQVGNYYFVIKYVGELLSLSLSLSLSCCRFFFPEGLLTKNPQKELKSVGFTSLTLASVSLPSTLHPNTGVTTVYPRTHTPNTHITNNKDLQAIHINYYPFILQFFTLYIFHTTIVGIYIIIRITFYV